MAMSGPSQNHSPKSVGVSSPWKQVVAVVATPSSPSPPPANIDSSSVNSATAEDSDIALIGHNVNSVKKPVWSKPSNVGSPSVISDDNSWPTLKGISKAPLKSPLDSLKPPADSLSSPLLQGTGNTLLSPQGKSRDDAKLNNMNPMSMTHEKHFKRSNSNLSSNGGHTPQLSLPQGSNAPPPGSYIHNSSPKDHQPRAGFIPNDQHRNSFRNRNGGHGDGAHHHSYGNRREQDRSNQDWNTHRNFNGRDMTPRFGPRMMRPRPPQIPAPLFPPPPPLPMRPFGFPELPPQMVYVPPPHLDSLRGGPFGPPMLPNGMFFPTQDIPTQDIPTQDIPTQDIPTQDPPPLHTKIVNQIDYYFSNENLIKDIYLRMNMDDKGWVPINLIAGFKKVKHLTEDIQIVLDAVRNSSVVEVQGDKIRKQNNWDKWIMSPEQRIPHATTSQSVGQLAEKAQSMTLETPHIDDSGVKN